MPNGILERFFKKVKQKGKTRMTLNADPPTRKHQYVKEWFFDKPNWKYFKALSVFYPFANIKCSHDIK